MGSWLPVAGDLRFEDISSREAIGYRIVKVKDISSGELETLVQEAVEEAAKRQE